jgi:hypothetical protein
MKNMKGSAYHGWKFRLPDKFWPVTLDNFFDNPDEIRELGLHMMESDKVVKSSDGDGKWPGYRSQELWKIDEELTQKICEKVLSCYFNLNVEKVYWHSVDIRFQSISSINKNKNSIKNQGWIHKDVRIDENPYHPEDKPGPDLAGLIYLTPDIERDTGTSLYNMKKDKTLKDWQDVIETRYPLYKGDPISEEEIKEKWEIHRSCFIEKVRFENIYNRLIMYDTKEFHAANSYYTSKDNRLTLGFFIAGIKANKWPLERIGNINT